eukprot:UN05419
MIQNCEFTDYAHCINTARVNQVEGLEMWGPRITINSMNPNEVDYTIHTHIWIGEELLYMDVFAQAIYEDTTTIIPFDYLKYEFEEDKVQATVYQFREIPEQCEYIQEQCVGDFAQFASQEDHR